MSEVLSYNIDIIGTCNLRCPSCPVGNIGNSNGFKGLMDVGLFEKIIKKIKVESPNVHVINLFNWAEAFLHPELPKFIEIVNNYGLICKLSTNLNKITNLYQIIEAKPSGLRISLSGFFQETYARTHKKGDIEIVKSNMYKLRKILDELNSNTYIEVLYHKYIDNMGEDLERMRALCAELKFNLVPVWAYMMSVDKMFDYYEDKTLLTKEDENLIDLLIINPDEAREVSENYQHLDCTLRSEQTTINADGTVALCCGVYDKKYTIADSFLDITEQQLSQKKYSNPTCIQCMNHSMHMASIYAGEPELEKIADRNISKYKKANLIDLAQVNSIELKNREIEPLVSIGLILTGNDKFLKLFIDSLLSQNYDNFELLIFSHSANDKTVKMCQDYGLIDQRIKFKKITSDSKISNYFNFVFEHSKGEYFIWASNEIYFHENYIKKCISELKNNPTAGLCSADPEFLDDYGRKSAHIAWTSINTKGQQLNDRLESFIFRGTMWIEFYGVYRRSVLEKINLSSTKYQNELIILLNILFTNDIISVPEKLIYYHYKEKVRPIQTIKIHGLIPGTIQPNKIFTTLFKLFFSEIISSDIDSVNKLEIQKIFFNNLSNPNSNFLKYFLDENSSPEDHISLFLTGLFFYEQTTAQFSTVNIKKELLKNGLNYYKKKNYIQAEIMFEKLSGYEENADYLFNLGLSQYYQNKFEESVDSFASSLELGAATYDVCNYLAKSLEKLGDKEMAKLYFEKALELK